MRHLKTYESFYDRIESDLESGKYRKRQEHLRVLEDMSLELWDDNFNVQLGSIYSPPDKNYMKVTFQKRGHNLNFNYDNIKDTLLSMVSYMESEGYKIRSISILIDGVFNYLPAIVKDDKLYLDDTININNVQNLSKVVDESKEILNPIIQLVIKFEE